MGTTCGHGPTLRVAMVLARLAGSGPRFSGTSPEQKAPWARSIALPVAGEGARRSLKPNDLRKQAGRQRASREQVRAGRWRRRRLCRRLFRIPGGLGKGCASTWRCRSLQSTHRRARDRRCPSKTDRGKPRPAMRSSRVARMARLLCGESRSGPDPSKHGQRDIRKDGHAAGNAVRRGLNPDGTSRLPGSMVIRAVLVDRIGRRNRAGQGEGSRKRAERCTATMEGALG